MKTSIILFFAASLFCHGDTLISIYEMSDQQTGEYNIPVEIMGFFQGYRPEIPRIYVEKIKSLELLPAQNTEDLEKVLIHLTEKDDEELSALTQKIAPGKIYLNAAGIIESTPFLRNPYLSGGIVLHGTKSEISKIYQILQKGLEPPTGSEPIGHTTRD